MTSNTTPFPWELCERGDYADFDGNSRVILGDDRRIAVIHVSDEESEATAQFIFRACNSHDALVEKLKAQFHAVDWLMAKLIEADPTFLPSKSPIWDSIKGTHEVLAAAGVK